mgnify:CR=1 FL=1
MKYAVMFEPFEFEGHQYVREAIDGGSWSDRDSPKTFNTKEVGFNVNKIKKFPFSIGAGRSLGYKLLNRINWQVYPNKVDSLLDTISLFKLLMLNNASFITLKTTDFFIISIKKSDKNVINTLHDLKISKNISYSIL